MKTYPTPTAVLAAAALVIAMAGPAHASGDDLDPWSALDAAVSAQPPTPVTSALPSLSDQLEREGATVSAPTGREQILELTLPGDSAQATAFDNLEFGVTAGSGYTTAIEDSGSGTFRALVEIKSADAPTTYAFSLGDGTEAVPLEDGGISVRDAAGHLLGIFEPAWAVDARGDAIPTWYEVRGATLIQHIGFTSATAFPVVADPFWIPALFVMARLTGHVLTRAAQRGVSEALIKQVVQNGVRSAGNKGTSVFTQGSGKNRIRVVVDNRTGDIITVTKG